MYQMCIYALDNFIQEKWSNHNLMGLNRLLLVNVLKSYAVETNGWHHLNQRKWTDDQLK